MQKRGGEQRKSRTSPLEDKDNRPTPPLFPSPRLVALVSPRTIDANTDSNGLGPFEKHG